MPIGVLQRESAPFFMARSMQFARYHVSAIAAALLVSAGIALPHVWWLVLVGMGFVFWLMREHTNTSRRAFLLGAYIGVFSSASAIVWFWSAIPLVVLNMDSLAQQILGVGVTWLYVAVGQALAILFGVLVLWRFRHISFFSLLAGVVWAVAEVGRMWMFAWITVAPESLMGPHFSTASIGYALTESHFLLQVARPFGLHGLNFIAAAMPALLACYPAFRSRVFRPVMILQTILLFLMLLAPVWMKPEIPGDQGGSLRVAILAEQIDLLRDRGSAMDMEQLLAQAGASVPEVDIIVIPEALSLTTTFGRKSDADAFLQKHFGARDLLFLHTRRAYFDLDAPSDERLTPEKLYFDSTLQGVMGIYEKQFLVPLGEYAPTLRRIVYGFTGVAPIREHLDGMRRSGSRRGTTMAVSFHGVRVGALLCSDALSPRLYRDLVRREQADVLVNLANHHWFHHSRSLFWKTLQMSRVHAVHNQRPFLVANNYVPSYALDRLGRVIVQSDWGTRDVLFVDVP